MIKTSRYNSTFTIGVFYTTKSFMVKESVVFSINISAEKHVNQQSENCYGITETFNSSFRKL